MLEKLCGERAAERIVLVSTGWETVPAQIAEEREMELCQTLWRPFPTAMSRTARFEGTYESAWSIIRTFLREMPLHGIPLLLQEEMCDLHRDVRESASVKALHNELQQLLANKKETLRRMRIDAENTDARALDNEYGRILDEVNRTHKQLSATGVPLSRKLPSFLSQKASAVSAFF